MKKALLAGAMALGLLASPALASEPTPVSSGIASCYVGGHAGLAVSGLDVDVNGLTVADLSAQGLSGGVRGGCDWLMSRSSPIVLGVWGDYTWHQGDFELLGFEVFDVGSQWAVGGRVGYKLFDPLMVYVLAGYTELELDGGDGIDVDPDFGGWTLGGGVEMGVVDGVIIGAEYRYSNYSSELEDFVDLDPTVHQFMVTAKYAFSVM